MSAQKNDNNNQDSFASKNSRQSKRSRQGGDQQNQSHELPPKPKMLNRSQIMDNMLFPENCPTLVIVPSNKEGTGFLNHCYDQRYLKDYITEKEFNAIVMISSKLAAKCYSKKKMLDKKGVDTITKWVLVLSTFLAIISLVTVLEGFAYGESQILLYISHLLIAPSLIAVFVVSIINWKKKVVKPITFNQMVKHDLDDFYEKINPDFKQQGIEWATIEGHYWLEIRLQQQKKQGSRRSNIQKNLSKKLMRILQNAEIQGGENIIRQLSAEDKQNNFKISKLDNSGEDQIAQNEQVDTEHQQLVEEDANQKFNR